MVCGCSTAAMTGRFQGLLHACIHAPGMWTAWTAHGSPVNPAICHSKLLVEVHSGCSRMGTGCRPQPDLHWSACLVAPARQCPALQLSCWLQVFPAAMTRFQGLLPAQWDWSGGRGAGAEGAPSEEAREFGDVQKAMYSLLAALVNSGLTRALLAVRTMPARLPDLGGQTRSQGGCCCESEGRRAMQEQAAKQQLQSVHRCSNS